MSALLIYPSILLLMLQNSFKRPKNSNSHALAGRCESVHDPKPIQEVHVLQYKSPNPRHPSFFGLLSSPLIFKWRRYQPAPHPEDGGMNAKEQRSKVKW
ncbi:hypothetical protein BDP81DRAFT_92710 [Colletotrichum phormii]|uniref:Uncharacterized protein n=1 Tax=Colletotrichum phormii TaxID=359342 RepID=A0AAJ0A5L7_9PEZI|nr:uncharacterized protein BDP81DRAFT_92710 [Colletotrichum phormii]KAK1655015.1 hypothetical protein BDP81DRAFT_92710 [Colletotrichum phormii]